MRRPGRSSPWSQAAFADHFGDLDAFAWPVTRADALAAFKHFLVVGLPAFGDYQDAMRARRAVPVPRADRAGPQRRPAHAGRGLRAAERAYRAGAAPLHCVEGFIRQILGWREYVRGLYWARMPDYAATNALEASRDLPWFYWSGETA